MATHPTMHRPTLAYGVGVLGLVFAVVVALALPSRTVDVTCRLDCSPLLNMAKIGLILLGLLIALAGALVGGFLSYLERF